MWLKEGTYESIPSPRHQTNSVRLQGRAKEGTAGSTLGPLQPMQPKNTRERQYKQLTDTLHINIRNRGLVGVITQNNHLFNRKNKNYAAKITMHEDKSFALFQGCPKISLSCQSIIL